MHHLTFRVWREPWQIGHVAGVKMALDGQISEYSETLQQDIILSSFRRGYRLKPEFAQSLIALKSKGGQLAAWAFGLHDPRAGPSPKIWNPLTWQPRMVIRHARLEQEGLDMTMPLDWRYHR